MTVPFAFANLSGNIALAKLDSNFNTPITIGNTSVLLGNTITTINNVTLANVTISSGTASNISLTSPLAVSSGGTGSANLTVNNVLIGNGTSAVTSVAPGTTGNVLTSIGGAWVSNVAMSGAAAGANTQVQYNNSGALGASANLTFDGTNLGIGTSSPGVKLEVSSSSAILRLRTSTARGSGNGYMDFYDPTGRKGYFGYGGADDALYIANDLNAPLVFFTNATEKMRLDSSGNLGLGVTPSAWGTYSGIIDLKGNGSVAAFNQSILMAANAYYNGTDFIYKATTSAGYYQIAGNQFQWNIAPSGTAGNAITFTQAMTLDASGNLLVGTTSVTNGAGWDKLVQIYATNYPVLSLKNSYRQWDTTVYGSSGALIFYDATAAAERMRLDSSGKLLVGATSNAGIVIGNSVNPGFVVESGGTFYNQVNTGPNLYMSKASGYSSGIFQTFYTEGTERGSISYNGSVIVYATSSDYRLKTLSSRILASDAGARIDALNPIEYIWKENNRPERGFFAHEFQSVYPNSVNGEKDAIDSVGNPLYQSMQASSSEVIADLITEIQSLRIRIAQLEAK